MVDIQSISVTIAATSVVVGIVYYIIQIRHQGKVRETDITFRLYSQACSKEFVEAMSKLKSMEYEDYKDFVKKYGDVASQNPVPIALAMVGMFFEGIGVLLHRRLVDGNLLWELFSVTRIWEELEPLVEGVRKERHHPHYFEWFEYLYNEMKKSEQRK